MILKYSESKSKSLIFKLYRGFEELDFVDQNLHQHLCRIYMMGTNELNSLWQLPSIPPVQLRNRIYLDKYNEFVEVILL